MEQGQQLPMNFNLNDARDMECQNCGGKIFLPAYRFKKISRLLTGQPKDSVMPIELYVCASCGAPLNELLPQELQETKIAE
jgi:DNA-directed RNA polymerase subunit RPC12/RpoP